MRSSSRALLLLGVAEYVPSRGHASCEHLYGGGWIRVRHVPAGNNWHPATDRLTGIQEYGVEGNDESPWSVIFSTKNTPSCTYDEFLFATGDCTLWLAATTDAVNGEFYGYALRPILASSDNPNSYSAGWLYRDHPNEPWISIIDIDNGLASNAGKIIYGGNGVPQHTANILPLRGGADVYIRDSNCQPTPAPSKTPTASPSESPSTATASPSKNPTAAPSILQPTISDLTKAKADKVTKSRKSQTKIAPSTQQPISTPTDANAGIASNELVGTQSNMSSQLRRKRQHLQP